MRKIIFIVLFLISLFSISSAQSCPNVGGSFNSQSDVDDFVATYGGTCNGVGWLVLSGDFDYSGLSFIDTVYNILSIQSSITSLNGLQNIKHTGKLYLNSNTMISLPDIGMLDLKSIGEWIRLRNVEIPNLSFLDDITSISDDLWIRSVSFTNTITPSLPNLDHVGEILLENIDPLVNLNSFYSNLTFVGTLFLKEMEISDLQSLLPIDTLQGLKLQDNPSLINLDFSGLDMLKTIDIISDTIQGISNLNIASLDELAIIGTNINTLNFLSSGSTIKNLSLVNTQLTSLIPLTDIAINESIYLSGNSLLGDLQGLENVNSLTELTIEDNSLLTSIDELSALQELDEFLVINNPLLTNCCVISTIFNLASSGNVPLLLINNNGIPCGSLEDIQNVCIDSDGDSILDYADNCPNTMNPLQIDTDGDGLGDACDNCSTPINIQLTTQSEVDDAESLYGDGCIINNLYIEGEEEIVDLRPLSFITSVSGTLGIIDNENLQSLDGLENITEVGGFLEIFSNEALTNINGLSNVTKIGGLSIGETNLLQNIEAFSSIDSIKGDLSIFGNFSLSFCCAIQPFLNGEKYLQGSSTISGNLTGCSSESEINTACGDSDNDDVVNVLDNCPGIFNINQDDFDKDGIGDVCDNCQTTFNPNQVNQDGDLFGDACDLCPTITGNNLDSDNNGVGDACESLAGQESGFIGIGTTVPAAKVQVEDGDIFLNNVYRGVILRSPDGNCFRMKVQNDGSIVSNPIDCPED
ncbi:MAG: thrombospondin type 3 repeat-containing protein [Saprospiraceae bacterium]|nr:thrombospondin type 3 repeat-containing protein [Saprospiraceae bacterium]